MFRFLALAFLTIFVLDIVVTAFKRRRVWFMWGIFIGRRSNPVCYWLMTAMWCATVGLGLFGLPLLLHHAINSSGPYKDHAFFSLHQAWPYGFFALLGGWLASMIIKDWTHKLRDQSDGPAA
jgi:hypothetical protein